MISQRQVKNILTALFCGALSLAGTHAGHAQGANWAGDTAWPTNPGGAYNASLPAYPYAAFNQTQINAQTSAGAALEADISSKWRRAHDGLQRARQLRGPQHRPELQQQRRLPRPERQRHRGLQRPQQLHPERPRHHLHSQARVVVLLGLQRQLLQHHRPGVRQRPHDRGRRRLSELPGHDPVLQRLHRRHSPSSSCPATTPPPPPAASRPTPPRAPSSPTATTSPSTAPTAGGRRSMRPRASTR